LEDSMLDLLYVLIVIGFFAVCLWLIDALDKLKE
jgi:hypothetical protein